ncbi:MAG: AbrB/MazE/SpoVT family DNA-binding domain-containing protein [bacterium]|nr:AbrB/MazE/SpoVT family DNA-binding domain-containing protein [bacterium]MDZ4284920.1 AbrB/MazE/SpoVT family DNA-binding domain-containing protein [Patescibacteria group bacterium]
METTIQKWGNSLAVRLPRALVAHHRLHEGVRVVLRSKKEGLTIRAVSRRRPTLRELVDQITPENRHEAIDWGPPVGREIW